MLVGKSTVFPRKRTVFPRYIRIHLDTCIAFRYVFHAYPNVSHVSLTQATYSNVFSMYSELTVKIHVTIRLQYIHGYNFRNTHTIHPRYMCIQMYSDQRHQDTLGYNTIQRKCMYLPLGCLCAPRYALNTPKIRVSAPSLPAFTFFTCPGPPEEGLAPMYPMYSGMHIPRSLQVPLYASLHTLA